jgi:hypothetical protein
MMQLPEESSVVRGWKSIAAAIGVSIATARRRAEWGQGGRLPVWEDHRGPVATVSSLRSWMLDQLLPAGVRRRMARREREEAKRARRGKA